VVLAAEVQQTAQPRQVRPSSALLASGPDPQVGPQSMPGGVTVGISGTTVLGCPPLLLVSAPVDCRAAWSLSAAWPLS
jgi:hypothetical protein